MIPKLTRLPASLAQSKTPRAALLALTMYERRNTEARDDDGAEGTKPHALAWHHTLRGAPQNPHIEMRGPSMTVPSAEIFLLHRISKQTHMQRGPPWYVLSFSLFKNRPTYFNPSLAYEGTYYNEYKLHSFLAYSSMKPRHHWSMDDDTK